MEKVTVDEFLKRYCERQMNEPEPLRQQLLSIRERVQCDGFMLLECQQLDSSRLGSLTILPFGGQSTYKEPPSHPISPRGLASDTSVVVAIIAASDLSESVNESA